MRNIPRVSIIVPIYNVESYLHRCMDSLLNQTLKDIEIILVDDESPDNCPALCDEYAQKDNRVKVIHKKNGGLGFARNSGLEIATGEYVAFVDSDDYVDNLMFEKLYDEAAEQDSEIVYCNYSFINNKRIATKSNDFKENKTLSDRHKIDEFLFNMIGSPPNSPFDRKYNMSVWRGIYSMKLINRNKLKFQSERLMISEDLIFHICCLPVVTKISYCTFYGYNYCLNNNSLSKSFRNDRMHRYIVLHKEMDNLLSKYYSLEKYQNSIDRCLIGFTRKNVVRITKAKISFGEKFNQLKLIINDNYFHSIIKRFPGKNLPLKQKLFIQLFKILNVLC